ncbi:hypothetical protein [Mesorhizobium sp.]|uniref:phosphotransferase-like protein n=1 Tax=Mesorhizobium sp. TaxID=1871066 RepID=UPI0012018B60|nr:hypothetical protein [Mesorhizobium sp.]TIO09857.1 MAG: hypothetical protein E5X88_07490 [Mesorhizobium sp.]TIO34341.1 MAG: hypothetical protein E5X89_12955 [Mesorhizobium sp.]
MARLRCRRLDLQDHPSQRRRQRRQRADRLPGLARWQYDRVHKDIGYDLEIDTSTLTPLECARCVKAKFQL